MDPNAIAQASQPAQPNQNPPLPAKKANQKLLLGAILGVFALIVIVAVSFFFISQANAATVSGFINFNALKPDPQDSGNIVLKYRLYGTNEEYKTINYTPQLQDTAPWTWTGAQNGQPYEVIAELFVDDDLVTTSEPLVVTAPAINQELILRVTWRDLPAQVVQQQETDIQGNVVINGLIPTGSTLLIQAKGMDQSEFQTIVTNANPTNTNAWTWNQVTPLKDYTVKAILINNATIIGTSDIINAAGGDDEAELMINSQAQPSPQPTQAPQPTPTPTLIIVTNTPLATMTPSPTPSPTPTPQPATGKISGKININGPKDANTNAVIMSRTPGQGNFQPITTINFPKDGQSWEWDDAVVGTNYEITTVLQVNNNTTATTRSVVVAAPAQNVDFTLNTGVTIPNVSGTPALAACTNNSNNQWDATLQFPNITNAGNYWLKTGTNPGAADTFNSKQRPQSNNNQQQITVRVDSKRSYYAQYAYSICVNCSSDQNFSNFSNTLQFTCGNDAPPVYKGYKCNTGNNTCEATTDSNAPFAYNNTGLTQCQLACKPPTSTPLPTATVIPTVPPTATIAPIITLPGPSPR